RDRPFVAKFMDCHMVHGKAAIARNDHHAIENAFIAESDRIGGDCRLRARYLAANIAGDLVFECAYAVERQRATDRHPEIDESLFPDCTDTNLLDRDHAGDFCDNSFDFFRAPPRGFLATRVLFFPAPPGGARSISVSIFFLRSRQPAKQTSTATTRAAP